MAKSEVVEVPDLIAINILWDAIRTGNHPKSVKESLLGTIRSLETRHGLEHRRYNHGS